MIEALWHSGWNIRLTQESWVRMRYCRVEHLARSFVLRCANSSSCMKKHMAIERGGYFFTNVLDALVYRE